MSDNLNMDDLIGKYIGLRDRRAVVKAEMDAKLGQFDAVMDQLERVFAAQLKAQGATSLKGDAGTVYLSTRSSAKVADWDAVLDHIRSQEAWHMLERKVNKTAVAEYRESNDALPPGVDWFEEQTVGVRRA